MEATERFIDLVTAAGEMRLDVGALCIAAHAHADLVVDEWLARLDDVAEGCASSSLDSVRAELFEVHRFRGDAERYEDPENSFLDSVIRRRRGIPISLSVLMIEIARRVGVTVLPVGMPGHFLVRAADDGEQWCDPFHRGRMLDRDACRALFDAVYRGARILAPSDLEPIPGRAVLARMLANLEHGELASDPHHLAWMCELHIAIPGVAMPERLQLLRRLARVVDPVRAARAYEAVSGTADPELATRLCTEARLLRSRMN